MAAQDDDGAEDVEALAGALRDLEDGEAEALAGLAASLSQVLGTDAADEHVDVDAIWSDIDRRLWGR